MACNPVGAAERRLNQFEKIRRLDEVTDLLLALGTDEITAQVNAQCPPMPAGEFIDIIDQTAVHPSLEGYTNAAERRFAQVVTTLQNAGEASIEEISLAVYQAGMEIGLLPMDTAEEAYEALGLDILDGMPCDETVRVLESGADLVRWQQVADLHSAHWEAAGGDPKQYRFLLRSYCDGLLSGTEYRLTSDGEGIYTLSRG